MRMLLIERRLYQKQGGSQRGLLEVNPLPTVQFARITPHQFDHQQLLVHQTLPRLVTPLLNVFILSNRPFESYIGQQRLPLADQRVVILHVKGVGFSDLICMEDGLGTSIEGYVQVGDGVDFGLLVIFLDRMIVDWRQFIHIHTQQFIPAFSDLQFDLHLLVLLGHESYLMRSLFILIARFSFLNLRPASQLGYFYLYRLLILSQCFYFLYKNRIILNHNDRLNLQSVNFHHFARFRICLSCKSVQLCKPPTQLQFINQLHYLTQLRCCVLPPPAANFQHLQSALHVTHRLSPLDNAQHPYNFQLQVYQLPVSAKNVPVDPHFGDVQPIEHRSHQIAAIFDFSRNVRFQLCNINPRESFLQYFETVSLQIGQFFTDYLCEGRGKYAQLLVVVDS